MIKNEKVEKSVDTAELEWQPENLAEKAGVDIVSAIQNKGGEAYFVGGYVRDLVIQKKYKADYPDVEFDPGDVDIATNFNFEQLEAALKKELVQGFIGIKYTGANNKIPTYVATLEIGGEQVNIDVASYRLDGDYDNESRDCQCEIAKTLEDDAERRDFTINGLYFDPITKEIIDPVNGLADLENKKLRFIGSAEKRIKDDPLRIFRYVRFRNKYGLSFDQGTKRVIAENLDQLAKIKKERLANNEKGELNKIMLLPSAWQAVADLGRLGVLQKVLPEVYQLFKVPHNPKGEDDLEVHLEGDVYRHTLEVMRSILRPEFIKLVKELNELPQEMHGNEVLNYFLDKYGYSFNWGSLLHDIGKPAKQQENTRGQRKVYSFIEHAEESSEMLNKISQRVGMPDELKQKIDFLVGHHMEAGGMIDGAEQINQHGFGTNQKKILRSHPLNECQALLFLSLADILGTFTKREKSQLSEKFKLVWEKLNDFKANEGNAEKMAASKKILTQVVFEFFPEAMGNEYAGQIIGLLLERIEKSADFYDQQGLLSADKTREFLKSCSALPKIKYYQNINEIGDEELKAVSSENRQIAPDGKTDSHLSKKIMSQVNQKNKAEFIDKFKKAISLD